MVSIPLTTFSFSILACFRVRANTGCLGVRIMSPSGETCLNTVVSVSCHKNPASYVGLVQRKHSHCLINLSPLNRIVCSKINSIQISSDLWFYWAGKSLVLLILTAERYYCFWGILLQTSGNKIPFRWPFLCYVWISMNYLKTKL